MNAELILKEKGYDNFDCADILQANDDNLDMKVREKYGLDTEPLHLWESYYIGDADEKKVLKAAKKFGYNNIDGLLLAMDKDLLELCEQYPSKKKRKA